MRREYFRWPGSRSGLAGRIGGVWGSVPTASRTGPGLVANRARESGSLEAREPRFGRCVFPTHSGRTPAVEPASQPASARTGQRTRPLATQLAGQTNFAKRECLLANHLTEHGHRSALIYLHESTLAAHACSVALLAAANSSRM